MSTTFRHDPSGRVLTIDRDPALGNRHRTTFQQNVVASDSGKRSVFSRKIPVQLLEIVFDDVTNQQQADLEEFYRRVLREGDELFDLEVVPVVAAAWQVGMTVNGSPVQCGDSVKKDVDADGQILQCGRYYRFMDSIVLASVRIEDGSYRTSDGLRNGSTVAMTIVQELPLVL